MSSPKCCHDQNVQQRRRQEKHQEQLPQQQQKHVRKRTNMDIAFPVGNSSVNYDDDPPSPMPSPYVGTILKGSRRKRQQQKLLQKQSQEENRPANTRMRSLSLEGYPASEIDFDIERPPPWLSERNDGPGFGRGGGGGGSDGGLATPPGTTPTQTAVPTSTPAETSSEKTPLIEVSFEGITSTFLDELNKRRTRRHSSGEDSDYSSTGGVAIRRTPSGNLVEDDDNGTNVQTVLETIGESFAATYHKVEETVEEAMAELEERRNYDWREFWKGGTWVEFCHWIVTGLPSSEQTTEEIQENLNSLARMIVLLREYKETHGVPTGGKGGPRDCAYVLREITRDLYAGGCPIWALHPVLKNVAEGLTGRKTMEFLLLPRRTVVYEDQVSRQSSTANEESNAFATSMFGGGAMSMFSMTRGYDLRRLDDMEKVAVRLASFASNTSSSTSVPVRWPRPLELRQAFRSEVLSLEQTKQSSTIRTKPSIGGEDTDKNDTYDSSNNNESGTSNDGNDNDDDEEQPQHPQLMTQEELAEEILDLASESEGLFFFVNAHQSAALRHENENDDNSIKTELGAFWKVGVETRNLFSHLACMEAMMNIDKMDAERKPLYSPLMIMLFRIGASSGACAFWFSGSWVDIFVSGFLAVLIAWIGSTPVLTSQERIIFEAVASFVVGFVAALVAVTFPQQSCFGAMAISGVLDLLQGFRVVYAIIEIMSRHTITGGADFLEGIFFTSLIAYFLRFGQYSAFHVIGEPEDDEYLICNKGVSKEWYFFFVPLAALSWSGLFNPYKVDLPVMALHGCLGYVVSWQFAMGPFSTLNNFLAAVAVTFSAGFVSRFTGRQALGNTVAGIYVLLPGAYLVDSIFKDRVDGFLSSIILRACIIGVGAWTGTVLCSPTLLGRSKANPFFAASSSLGAPALTGPTGYERANSDASFASEATSVARLANEDGRWHRRRRGRRTNGGSLFSF